MIFDLLRDFIHLLPLSLTVCLALFSDPKIIVALLSLLQTSSFFSCFIRKNKGASCSASHLSL